MKQHEAHRAAHGLPFGIKKIGYHLQFLYPLLRFVLTVGIIEQFVNGHIAQQTVVTYVLSVKVLKLTLALLRVVFLLQESAYGSHELLNDAYEVIAL